MRMKNEHIKLFDELEVWCNRKDAYSVNDFLLEKGINTTDFETIANRSKKFMTIWGKAESRTWENLKEALFSKSLPRSRVADYIRESDVFEDDDPEETMRTLEEAHAQLTLYQKALSGDMDALLKCSLNFGLMSEEHYKELINMEDDEDE